jgi:phosphoglycolate phosphatase-like HAD superfamily hydrolase
MDQTLWSAENAIEAGQLYQHPNWTLNRPIYIFDMDGTICDSTHRHHFLQSVDAEGNVVSRPGGKDWTAFFAAQKDDSVFPAIAGIMEALIASMNLVIILTGRPEGQRAESVRWLREWSIPYHALFMRPEDNRINDNILKPIQIHTYLVDHVPNVRTIFEDRRRIVDSLRHHGFHVCHVTEGDF